METSCCAAHRADRSSPRRQTVDEGLRLFDKLCEKTFVPRTLRETPSKRGVAFLLQSRVFRQKLFIFRIRRRVGRKDAVGLAFVFAPNLLASRDRIDIRVRRRAHHEHSSSLYHGIVELLSRTRSEYH